MGPSDEVNSAEYVDEEEVENAMGTSQRAGRPCHGAEDTSAKTYASRLALLTVSVFSRDDLLLQTYVHAL